GEIPHRANGVLVSMVGGKAVAFGLNNLQDRSELFVKPGDELYEGMIVGENARDNDMVVNPAKEKKLSNMRASGTDENIIRRPPPAPTVQGTPVQPTPAAEASPGNAAEPATSAAAAKVLDLGKLPLHAKAEPPAQRHLASLSYVVPVGIKEAFGFHQQQLEKL